MTRVADQPVRAYLSGGLDRRSGQQGLEQISRGDAEAAEKKEKLSASLHLRVRKPVRARTLPVVCGGNDDRGLSGRVGHSSWNEELSRQDAKLAKVYRCVIGVGRFIRRMIWMLKLPNYLGELGALA